MITLRVNNKSHKLEGVDPDTPLLWVLRDHLDMKGTKFGCGLSQCGSCTVHLDGKATRSCVYPVSAVGEQEVTTIEGLAPEGELHPVQEAWMEHGVPQCGYCQVGQIMSAASLLAENAEPTDDEIDAGMSGNICRCGTYVRVRAAIHTAATKMKGSN
jgi:aerobic-type carbon monoxide dehydrogenase small subunit (CoxS/CutS family)